jgi:hypothetical protein
MVDQFADGSDGDNADRPKTHKEQYFPWDTEGGINQDGSNGIRGEMESMAESKADQEGKKEMNPAMEFKKASIRLFMDKAEDKYNKGQEEHGGYLPFDVIFKDLEDEIIDMWFYIQAMKLKVAKFSGSRGRLMFFSKEKSSTIEGMIRQSTDNKLY